MTAYQVLDLAMVAYSVGLAVIIPADAGLVPNLAVGRGTLRNPAVMLFLEVL
jgi:hypothetical protein